VILSVLYDLTIVYHFAFDALVAAQVS